MKIIELLDNKKMGKSYRNHNASFYSIYGYTATERKINSYLYDDCVICYKKESLGVIFIIKSKKKFFAFVSLKTGSPYFGGYDYKLAEIKLKDAFDLFDGNFITVDNELMDKLNKKIFVDGLKEVKV